MLNILSAPVKDCGNAEIYTKKIVKFLKSENEEYSVFFSLDYDMFKAIVENLANNGETEFVIVGGDEAISCFVNTVKDLSRIKMGIVPTSRADDFASFLNLSFSPVDAIKDILQRNIEAVDLLVVNEVRVINNVLIGASAEIFERYKKYKFKNIFPMPVKADKLTGVELTIKHNSKTNKLHVFDLVISNSGRCLGGNINSLCNVKDGQFNVNILKMEDEHKSPIILQRGKQIYEEKTNQLWLNSLKLFGENIFAVADGATINADEIDVALAENGLKIYKKVD